MDDELSLDELEAVILNKTSSRADSMDISSSLVWKPQEIRISSLSTFGNTHISFDLPASLDDFQGRHNSLYLTN
jgi:hypothetical protein